MGRRYGPFKGLIKFSKDSGLRKLMRAARRGRIPDELLVVINDAIRSAEIRKHVYRNRVHTGQVK
jgi:hypothetical protein